MSKTSLSAYAAWLAKHETKVPRRRSLEAARESVEVVHVVKDPSSDVPTDPYRRWVTRKETKPALLQVAIATPDTIDAIVERGRAAVAMAQLSKSGLLGKALDSATVPHKTKDVMATEVHGADARGKKRGPTESATEDSRGAKKTKVSTTTASSAVASSTTSIRALTTQSNTSKTSIDAASERPASCSASRAMASRGALPMLQEVRYWQDVDRFSFLA